MNTDEMILELVATGKFTLPKMVFRAANGNLCHSVGNCDQRMIHDLCAMHFAREAPKAMRPAKFSGEFNSYFRAQLAGDSAAAIAALHGAVCAPA